MLTDDEVADVVSHLSERHSWYMDNLPNPASRFHGICAEVGINEDEMTKLIDFVIMQHSQLPPQMIPGFVVQSVCHGIWVGIELGKKIGAVISSHEN